jgi:hypothetical protein
MCECCMTLLYESETPWTSLSHGGGWEGWASAGHGSAFQPTFGSALTVLAERGETAMALVWAVLRPAPAWGP